VAQVELQRRHGRLRRVPQVVVQVRDSKDPDGPVLTFGPEAWLDFVWGIKAGQFAPP
jgi:hypothetical protein